MKTNKHLWTYPAQLFLKRQMFQAEVVEKIKTHILSSTTFFRISCHLWDNVKKMLYSWIGRKLQYGLYALHALYLSLQTHIQNLLLSHCNNCWMNSAPQCYATGTLPISFTLRWRWQKSVYCYHSSCHNYFHLTVVFKSVAANILFQRQKQTIIVGRRIVLIQS
jgi:hypothetical protein